MVSCPEAAWKSGVFFRAISERPGLGAWRQKMEKKKARTKKDGRSVRDRLLIHGSRD
jgi:hypothetical protein